jgi:hypothetical protein
MIRRTSGGPFQRATFAEVEAFAADIERAISLRESFFHREMDATYTAGQGKTFWAIDPSVINAYFRNSDDLKRWQQYRLFSHPKVQVGDEEGYSNQLFDILVGMLIGRSGVARAQPEHRLLLLPSHTSEAKSAYDTVVKEFENASHSKRPRSRLNNFLNRLERVSAADRVALAENQRAELHQILYGVYDAHQKFRTFSSALAERRLVTIKGARYEDYFTRLNSAPKIVDVADGKVRRIRDDDPGSESWWRAQLKGMPSIYAESDAVALSRLYELNLALEKQQCRIVLVTDNAQLIASGQRIIPAKYDGKVISSDTFADLYLRHPLSFLSERDIMLPGSQNETPASMTGWLDAFLAKISIQDRRDLASFRTQARRFGNDKLRKSIARHALERFSDIHSSLVQDWSQHVSNVLLAHVSTSSPAIARYADMLAAEDRGRVEILTQFENIVQEMTEASWNEFLLSAAKSGYELVEITGSRSTGRMRNIPRLYLRGLHMGERLLELLADRNGAIEHAAEIRQGLDGLQTSNNQADFYAAALCLGVLFAYADRWPIASALANRAVEIGDRSLKALMDAPQDIDWNGSVVTGREANYLACVTGRLSARSIDDLARCEGYLKQSIAAWRFEEEQRAAQGAILQGYAPITGLRAGTERLSIETAKALFTSQAAKWLPTGDSDFIQTLRHNIVEIENALGNAGTCEEPSVRRAMMIDLRFNLFSNWMLLEIEQVLSGMDTARAETLVSEQIADILPTDQTFTKGDMPAIDAYSILYAASFDSACYERLLAEQSWAGDYSAVVEPRTPSLLMPYDRLKCRRMMEFAIRHVQPTATSSDPLSMP